MPTEWSSSTSLARLRARAGSVIGSAADLDHDRLAGEAADVGQRLDQDARGFVGVDHDVAAFSLM